MRHRPACLRSLVIGFLGLLVVLAACGQTRQPSVHRAGPPTATSSAGLSQVGPLVAGSSVGGLHFCTASVVASPGRDLLVTAAHCLSGTATNLLFVPMLHDATAPFGAWMVRAAYVGSGWLTRRDPHEDVAFLALEPQQRQGRAVEVEDAVGADRLVTSQGYADRATVVGYPIGTVGRPISCTNEVAYDLGYPAFECDGYVSGTSGSPWITNVDARSGRGDLYGVIGGLHQGGCTPRVSYSSYFGPAVRALYQRAVRGGPGDDVPPAGNDGC